MKPPGSLLWDKNQETLNHEHDFKSFAASAGGLLWHCGDLFGKPVGAEVIVVGAGMTVL